jgi:hypothetical protein
MEKGRARGTATTDIRAAFQEMRGEGVTEGVAGGGLVDAGSADGLAHHSLHRLLVEMMPAPGARARIPRRMGSREEILPAEFQVGSGVFAMERVR